MFGKQLWKTVSLLSIALALTSCTSSLRDLDNQSDDDDDNDVIWSPTPTPVYTPYVPPVGTQSCLNISGTIAKVSPSGAVSVNQEVIFEINVLNCAKYRVERLDGGAGGTFTQSKIWYKKTYQYASSAINEGIRVIGIDSNGAEVPAITLTAAPFTVGAAQSSLACQASTNTPIVDIRVDSNGQAIDPPPTFQFLINSNRSTTLNGAVNLSGPFQPLMTIQAQGGTPATQHQFGAVIPSFYQQIIQFTVADAAAPSNTAKCTTEVYIRPVVQVARPTCTLTANKSSVYAGEVVTFTIQGQGSISSAYIGNQQVNPNGGQLSLAIYSTQTVTGTVYGPAGSNTCSAEVYVQSNPVKVGVNFEDAVDADYNDSVLCMTGSFDVSGASVISRANQTVSAQMTKISALNHWVTVKVVNPDGTTGFYQQFESRTVPMLNLPFRVGSWLEVYFDSINGGREGVFGIGSQYVRTGNYCNQTGN